MSTDVIDNGGTPPEVPGPFGAPVSTDEAAPTLRANTLNLFDSTVVAVSSVAPAYTLAATMAVLFTTVGIGYAGPAVIWISFVPVLFIAISYFHLNRRDPDCGASYAWLSKLVSPSVGWFNGWVQVATSILFCISAPIVAGQYTLQLFNEWGWISASTAASVGTAAVAAGFWLALITFICIWGIRWTTNFQWALLIIEYVADRVLHLGHHQSGGEPSGRFHQLPLVVAEPVLDRRVLRAVRRLGAGGVLLLGMGHRHQPQ